MQNKVVEGVGTLTQFREYYNTLSDTPGLRIVASNLFPKKTTLFDERSNGPPVEIIDLDEEGNMVYEYLIFLTKIEQPAPKVDESKQKQVPKLRI